MPPPDPPPIHRSDSEPRSDLQGPLGLELLLLAAAVLAPLAPSSIAPLVLLAVLGLWSLFRPPVRELAVAGPALGLAAALLLFGLYGQRGSELEPAAWQAEMEEAYGGIWERLDARAEAARRAVGAAPTDRASILAAFDSLATAQAGAEGWSSVLLIDPDGRARAWGGQGLLYEPEAATLGRPGRYTFPDFASNTLMVARPLAEGQDGERGWLVAAGISLPSDRLPFPSPDGRPEDRFRWSLDDGPPPDLGDRRVVDLGKPPVMILDPQPLADGVEGMGANRRRWAWGAIAFALLSLAVLRGVGLALVPGDRRRALSLVVLSAAGAVAVSLAADLPLVTLVTLGLGVGLATFGLAWPRSRLQAGTAAFWGGISAVLLIAGAWLYQGLSGPVDLSESFLGNAEVFHLRLGLAAAAFGLLALGGLGRKAAPSRDDRWGWLAVILLLTGAAAVDLIWLAVPLLIAAGGALGWWVGGRELLSRAAALAAFALLAALLAAASWEVAERQLLRQRLAEEALPRLGPPGEDEVHEVNAALRDFFGRLDLTDLAPRPAAGMELQDLAFTVWSRSPLVRRNADSAVALISREGRLSVFSKGLSFIDEAEIAGDLGWINVRRPEISLPGWSDSRIFGLAEVTAAGQSWGEARWWLAPRPGFRLQADLDPEAVLEELLRGSQGSPGQPAGLPKAARYALYGASGRPLISPFEEAAPVTSEEQASGLVPTPKGLAWAFSRQDRDGREVLYLPFLRPLPGLERVGANALWALFVFAAIALLVLLLALPRAAVRDVLRLTVRSYSKRLVLIYTLLLLLPLMLLNFVLQRGAERRLEDAQRVQGERALDAALREVTEELLNSPSGFSVGSLLNDELLAGVSRLVDHEVNLYLDEALFASSKRELFDAGLLPRRIPPEVFTRLALSGYAGASRTQALGASRFRELYAPLRLPQQRSDEVRLFLSVPLLAQQEEAEELLEAQKRQGLVVTAALFALVVAVGSRLARKFTEPLMELVEGTRRIAAGAESLDLSPSEVELAALVEAVDEMAGRIAEGRAKLVREKELITRMVDNITSGVVSVGADGRVLMLNRIAADLLGVQVGDRLDAAAGREERLAALQPFIAGILAADTTGKAARDTLRLSQQEGTETEWTLVWVPLPGQDPGGLLVVEDVTEMLRGQRLEAWAEMARIIAHEIKNPLTPVRLSAEHMRQVYSRDPERFEEVFDRCTSNILRQVDELQEIASEFSIYSRIPRAELVPSDLRIAMDELSEAYRAAPPPGIEVVFEAPGEPVVARFDSKLLGRAVRNLLENAVRASAGGGRVALLLEVVEERARIAVTDSGPGASAQVLSRIFEPYFSTHDTGTGLGLPIARRIVEEHGGEIGARNRPEGGLEVEIWIPLAER